MQQIHESHCLEVAAMKKIKAMQTYTEIQKAYGWIDSNPAFARKILDKVANNNDFNEMVDLFESRVTGAHIKLASLYAQ